MSALAERLSEVGRIVTQIHHRGPAPERWSYWDVGAATHGHADADYVVTSDGRKHQL